MRIRIAALIALVGFMMIGFQWVFKRFGDDHGQSHNLNPADYEVEVLSAAEFQRLADPAHETVTFDNGTKRIKAPAWYKNSLPKYKAIENGQRFVLVTAKGKAHFFKWWEQDMLPLAMILGSIVVLLAPLNRAQCPTTTTTDKYSREQISFPDG